MLPGRFCLCNPKFKFFGAPVHDDSGFLGVDEADIWYSILLLFYIADFCKLNEVILDKEASPLIELSKFTIFY